MDININIDEESARVLIEVHCYNRKIITELALTQLQRYKHNAFIRVVNDYSDPDIYDNEWLDNFSDESIIYEKKLNINILKYRMFKNFYNSGYEYLYMCDSDILHDPMYMEQLFKLYHRSNHLPVTLYNSTFINGFGQRVSRMIGRVEDGIIKQGLFGGCSVFLDRNHVKILMDNMLNIDESEWDIKTKKTAWDSQFQRYLNDNKYIVSSMSYCEHFGINGQNHKKRGSDQAIDPTQYLKDISEMIWNRLDI